VDDQATRDMVVEYFKIMTIQIPPDFIQFVLSSGLRALGKEKMGTLVLIICYYGISIPLSYIFCYVLGYGGKGLVSGSLINAYFLFIGLLMVYRKMDWNKQIQIANEKMKEDEISSDDDGNENEEKLI